ncbi:uncharacterized protein [Panulirus ornatus]
MMIGNRKLCLLTCVFETLMVITRPASAKPGHFTQTSFVSTGGVNSTIAAESRVKDARGNTRGDCIFTDEHGRSTKIKFHETSSGVVTAETDDAHVTDATSALKKCREAVARISMEVQRDLQEYHNIFKLQQAQFARQQEEFTKQQDNFRRQMEEFQNQMQEDQRRLQESLQRQQLQFQQQQEKLFQNLYNIPTFNFR